MLFGLLVRQRKAVQCLPSMLTGGGSKNNIGSTKSESGTNKNQIGNCKTTTEECEDALRKSSISKDLVPEGAAAPERENAVCGDFGRSSVERPQDFVRNRQTSLCLEVLRETTSLSVKPARPDAPVRSHPQNLEFCSSSITLSVAAACPDPAFSAFVVYLGAFA